MFADSEDGWLFQVCTHPQLLNWTSHRRTQVEACDINHSSQEPSRPALTSVLTRPQVTLRPHIGSQVGHTFAHMFAYVTGNGVSMEGRF